MIRCDLNNLSNIDKKHGITGEELQKLASKIPDFIQNIHDREQGFYRVIDDHAMVHEILEFAAKVEGKYDDIVVLGIGGSSLGTICLQQSLKHLFENELKERTYPRLHVLDNIDPTLIAAIEDIIDYKKTLFMPVTKSGGTPETLSQYFYFRKQTEDKGLDVKEHFVFITDPEKGLLRKIASQEGIPAFDVPPDVGGRFSVLTPVGLLPAKLIGIDIERLVLGAQFIRDQFLSEDFENNLPFQLAAIQYLLGEKGKIMNVVIPYSQKLIRFADWYRQLLAESIGKKLNNKGKEVNVGLTPINALGVTDQHSQSQLYNEGPNDKFFIFLHVEDVGPDIEIPNLNPDDPAVDYLKDVTFKKLIHTEMMGTIGALTQNDRPNITLAIQEVDEHNLGGLFMLFEAATAFLGEFYDINAFDQPGVELSKNLTKEMLRNN